MNPIQKALLELAETRNLGSLGVRETGRLIGEPHPQKVKYHLERLIESGHLKASANHASITKVKSQANHSGLIPIPILGAANCGVATIFADEQIEGYIHVSSSNLPKSVKQLYFIRAVGNSMNKANVGGSNIEGGDLILIDGRERSPKNGDYVVSVIGDVANVKKFTSDKHTGQIVLVSESSENHPPIFIHPKDLDSYMIAGKVLRVFKTPKN